MYFMYVAWTKLQLHMDRDKVLHIFPSEAQHWVTHPPSTQDPQSSVTCGKVLVWCGLVCCFSPLPFISNLSFSLVYLIHSYSIFHTFIYMYSQPWKTGGIVLCMLGIWSISFCAFFFHLVFCFWDPSMWLHGNLAHFFWLMLSFLWHDNWLWSHQHVIKVNIMKNLMRNSLVGNQLSGLVWDFIKFNYLVNDLESELAMCLFHL